MSFRIHFQDVPHSDRVRSECEGLTSGLRDEFPETKKFEVTISQVRSDYEAHLHVTGKDLSVNAKATGKEMHEAVAEAFAKAQRQLRKHHDKVIFQRRREAQKSSPK